MSNKTQPARGMRDFLPVDIRKRNYVIGIIKEVYESYGFEPLETPAVENLETLTGKYGEEGTQLMFKILKRGEKLDLEGGEKGLSDLALRYDLTVPLARVVANYKNELPKFFKRYQIQPVWRADRPAKGRFREFYQCDVDAIGSSSMMVEAEQISAFIEIFTRLGFKDFIIKLNHRKLLTGILEEFGVPAAKHVDALTALDKLDKIGELGVFNELCARNISTETCDNLVKFFTGFSKIRDENITLANQLQSSLGSEPAEYLYKRINAELLELASTRLSRNQNAEEGISEISRIINLTQTEVKDTSTLFDVSLARGLSYYTGAIFEVVLTDGDFAGSIGGGGRYDGLIGMFGKEQIPACGFSLGLERILVVMEERGMFPPELQTNSADVLITVWSEETVGESLKLAGELRAKGLRVLVYPEADKIGKQFKYADSIGIKTAIIMRDEEIAANTVKVKNLQTGDEETFSREEIAEKLKA